MQFEVRDNTIHVLNYPDADMILGLPDSQYVKRLKDMWLHWWDLNEAKQSLESMNSNNSDVVNRALAQKSIVVFYKCFGKSEFRDNSLKRNKILANFPPEAKKGWYSEYHHPAAQRSHGRGWRECSPPEGEDREQENIPVPSRLTDRHLRFPDIF